MGKSEVFQTAEDLRLTSKKDSKLYFTSRDKQILKAVSEYGCLMTNDLALLFDMGLKPMQRRLRALVNAGGYLDKITLPSIKQGRSPNLYFLAEKSCSLLAVNPYRPRVNYKLSHQMNCNRLLIDIITSTKAFPFHMEVMPEHLIRTIGVEKIISDGAFTLSKEGKKALFLLENCAGTEIIKSPTLNNDIESKIINYVEIFEENSIQKYKTYFDNYDFNRFRLLFVMNSNQRQVAISEIVSEHDNQGFIWITNRHKLDSRGILNAIWDVPALNKFSQSII